MSLQRENLPSYDQCDDKCENKFFTFRRDVWIRKILKAENGNFNFTLRFVTRKNFLWENLVEE